MCLSCSPGQCMEGSVFAVKPALTSGDERASLLGVALRKDICHSQWKRYPPLVFSPPAAPLWNFFSLFKQFWSNPLPCLNSLSLCQIALWLNASVLSFCKLSSLFRVGRIIPELLWNQQVNVFESRLFIDDLTKSMYEKADCFMYRMWLFAKDQFQERSINICI